MSAWETWFRTQGIDDVRRSLKQLESQIQNDTTQTHKYIGERFPDVIALSERLGSLQLLGVNLETHLAKFSKSNLHTDGARLPNIHGTLNWGRDEGAMVDHAQLKVEKLLLSLAERSIVQQKHVVAARALYLLTALGINSSTNFTQISDRLGLLLNRWVLSGDYVSQQSYVACLVHFRKSPSQFLSMLLEKRQKYMFDALKSSDNLADVIRSADLTLFIYNQLVSDATNSKLTHRRLTDLAEFGTLPLLSTFLTRLESLDHKRLVQIRAFPNECYDQQDFPSASHFINSISQTLELRTYPLIADLPDAATLLSVLRGVVNQAENGLCSADEGVAAILTAVEPPFAQKLLELVRENAHLLVNIKVWEHDTSALKASIAQLSKLSRSTRNFAPEFSDALKKLEERALSELQTSTKQLFDSRRKALLGDGKHFTELSEVANLIKDLTLLNQAFASLGGSPEPVPTLLYEELSRLLVEKQQPTLNGNAENEEPPARKAWGSSVLSDLFEIELLLDEALHDHDWDLAGLDTLRQNLVSKYSRPDELKATIYKPSDLVQRSSLLLKPLVQFRT